MPFKKSQIQPFGILLEATQEDVSIEELDLKTLKSLFLEEQLVVLRGFKTFQNAEEFSVYAEKWGEISLWPFGKVLELRQQETPSDHIFDNSYVPLHWDGMYRPEIPEYQIFHCVKAPDLGQGGNTIFTNTILTLSRASVESKDLWTRVRGVYERSMEFYSSRTISPIITKHPYRDLEVIRFNEPHSEERGQLVNIPLIKFEGLKESEIDGFVHDLRGALYDEKNLYSHEWKQEDVVIADNFSLLHGREKFQTASPRHIQRVQVLSQTPFKNPGLEVYQC